MLAFESGGDLDATAPFPQIHYCTDSGFNMACSYNWRKWGPTLHHKYSHYRLIWDFENNDLFPLLVIMTIGCTGYYTASFSTCRLECGPLSGLDVFYI